MDDRSQSAEVERMRRFAGRYAEKTGTSFHPDPEVTEAVLRGLAAHRAEVGRPLCPCRFYPDKAEEVRHRTWLCACDDMRRYKYCHCLLFVRPDGLPFTEHLPEGHPGREAWGLVADPTPGSGRDSERSGDGGTGGRGPDMERARPLYLEDLAVGQSFRTGTAPVDLGEVRAFA